MKTGRLTILLILLLTIAIASIGNDNIEKQKTALQLLQERAESGDPKALYDLAYLYDTGYDTIAVDSVKSTALYRLSAEKGYAPARNYLGFRYFNGEAVSQDVDSGLYWIAKAAAAGDVKGAANLGYLLAWSDKVTHDYPQALKWLEKASEAGLPTAQSLLADMLKEGLGTKPDTLQAFSLYRKAVAGGLQDAELKMISMMDQQWKGLTADSALYLGRDLYSEGAAIAAVGLFETSASEGNPEAIALLGDAYSKGLGVEYDYGKSMSLFLEAALLGNPSSEFVIGELLDIFPDALKDENALEIIESIYQAEEGEIPKELFTAEYWYEKAADAGITDAETASRVLLNGMEN